MFKHVSIEILDSFTSKEIAKFKEFLRSPYFNKSKKITQLFGIIVKSKNQIRKEKFTKKKLWEKLKTGRSYNDSTLRNLLAGLYHQIERFLIEEYLNELQTEKDYFFLHQVSSRKLTGLLDKNFGKVENKIDRIEEVDNKLFLDLFRIKYLAFDYRYLAKWKINEKTIEKALGTLVESKIALLAHLLCEIHVSEYNLLNYHRSYGYDFSKSPIHEIYLLLRKSGLIDVIKKESKQSFFVEIYAALLEAYEELEDETKYLKAKSLVEKYANRVTKRVLNNFYMILIGYANYQLNRNFTGYDFLTELFKLYKTALGLELYKAVPGGRISYKFFRNICTTGLRLKEYDWVEKFIFKYSKTLSGEESDIMQKLGLAKLYYAKNDLDAALNCLSKISPGNRRLKEDVALLNLRIFYDLKYYENLLFGIYNFKKMLKRDSIMPDEAKCRYLKFTDYLKIITTMRINNENAAEFKIVRKRLEKESRIFQKDWLLERCK